MRTFSSNDRPYNLRLQFSKVGSESCYTNIRDCLVNCAIFTIVLSLCRSFA